MSITDDLIRRDRGAISSTERAFQRQEALWPLDRIEAYRQRGYSETRIIELRSKALADLRRGR